MRHERENKPYVVYWNNIPAPYMVERFNAVADRGNLDFEAWFNDRIEEDRSWDVDEREWRFTHCYLPSISIGPRHVRFPLPILRRKAPDLLVSLYAEAVFMAGWTIARLRGTRTMFRVLMTHDSWVRRKWWKELLKRHMFRRVDGVETPGHDGGNFAVRYGVAKQRVFYATHAINVEHYKKGRKAALPKRDIIRRKLGLQGVTFIYVGRLWNGKGLYYLFDAFRMLQSRFEGEVSLLLVGDGKDERELREKCRKEAIRNVVFAGFKQKPDLPRYYAVADVFVFPTLGDPYGLVVDEAMACSLPIISTSAAGEIRDRIEDGVNGYIVPPEDSHALATRMLQLTENRNLRERMGKISAQKVSGHTPEQWAEDFEHIVYALLRSRP